MKLPCGPWLTLALLAAGCGTTHYARPQGKGNTNLAVSVGGPIVELQEKPVPMPLATIGVAYGVSDTVDVHGRIHPVLAGFDVIALDAGATWLALEPNGHIPALALVGSLFVSFDVSSAGSQGGCATCLIADLHGVASWAMDRHLVYLGFRSLLQAYPAPNRMVLAPMAGGELRVGDLVGLVLEMRWALPLTARTRDDLSFYAPGDLGVIGVLIGLNLHFGE